MLTTRKRHRSVSSSSPDSPPTLPSSEDPTRSPSPRPDSDFESLPAHLTGAAPRKKRRRKDVGREEPFIRTGFEDMVLESDGEDGVATPRQARVNRFPVYGQQEALVDSPPPPPTPNSNSRGYFTFPQNVNPAFYDTYRTRDAGEPDPQGDTPVVDDAKIVQPQSVVTPDADAEAPPSRWQAPWRRTGDPMVEDVSDPEAGGKQRGKTWYEPEKDREYLGARDTKQLVGS